MRRWRRDQAQRGRSLRVPGLRLVLLFAVSRHALRLADDRVLVDEISSSASRSSPPTVGVILLGHLGRSWTRPPDRRGLGWTSRGRAPARVIARAPPGGSVSSRHRGRALTGDAAGAAAAHALHRASAPSGDRRRTADRARCGFVGRGPDHRERAPERKPPQTFHRTRVPRRSPMRAPLPVRSTRGGDNP